MHACAHRTRNRIIYTYTTCVYISYGGNTHDSLASGRLQTSASENEKEREKMDYIVMYI